MLVLADLWGLSTWKTSATLKKKPSKRGNCMAWPAHKDHFRSTLQLPPMSNVASESTAPRKETSPARAPSPGPMATSIRASGELVNRMAPAARQSKFLDLQRNFDIFQSWSNAKKPNCTIFLRGVLINTNGRQTKGHWRMGARLRSPAALPKAFCPRE